MIIDSFIAIENSTLTPNQKLVANIFVAIQNAIQSGIMYSDDEIIAAVTPMTFPFVLGTSILDGPDIL